MNEVLEYMEYCVCDSVLILQVDLVLVPVLLCERQTLCIINASNNK